MTNSLLLVTPDSTTSVEDSAFTLFQSRFEDRSGSTAQMVTSLQWSPLLSRRHGLTVLAGTRENHGMISAALGAYSLDAVASPEGYLLFVPDEDKNQRELEYGLPGELVVVCGADPAGVLYGLGKLLRLMRYEDSGIAIDPLEMRESPVVAERGVYLATHFNNYYETAPIDDVLAYIGDLALWGVNTLVTWFDMHWYPEDFDEDPDSPGMRMMNRIRRMNEVARGYGMRVGLTGVANEGFQRQLPSELLTDISGQRGGFYPDSQICPSKPGGLELILRDRRKVMRSLGPVDVFWCWPYDQGGCGCAECSGSDHAWGKTFLAIAPAVAEVVRECSPDARFIVSTWLMDENERSLVDQAREHGTEFFDGLIVETRHAAEMRADGPYSLTVFPEISMFDTYFTSYGCNGANPAPRRFEVEAKGIAEIGCGAVPYSEGVYEDINKVIWMSLLWNPNRTAEEVVSEYCGYYFGEKNRQLSTEVVLGLENTWGPTRLGSSDPDVVHRFYEDLRSMEGSIPSADWCEMRWKLLLHRAKLDDLMVRIGPDAELGRRVRSLMASAAYCRCLPELRLELVALRDRLRERVALVDDLFDAYWSYMNEFHLERTPSLIFQPDGFLGKHDYRSLLGSLDRALSLEDDLHMRDETMKGLHRWTWLNGVDVGFFFL